MRSKSRPYARYTGANANIWGEGKDTVIHTKGHYAAASTLAAKLIEQDFDVSYAYRMRYDNGLPHAFINTLLYLDYDRKGFPYPVVPFHVNCYGSSVIAKRGSTAHLTGDADPNLVDPPGPNPRRCFDVGGAVAKALADGPWRVALIASSSWSHAFLTPKNHYLYPDNASDRARFDELCSGKLDALARTLDRRDRGRRPAGVSQLGVPRRRHARARPRAADRRLRRKLHLQLRQMLRPVPARRSLTERSTQ